jgi:hypothetical protein
MLYIRGLHNCRFCVNSVADLSVNLSSQIDAESGSVLTYPNVKISFDARHCSGFELVLRDPTAARLYGDASFNRATTSR